MLKLKHRFSWIFFQLLFFNSSVTSYGLPLQSSMCTLVLPWINIMEQFRRSVHYTVTINMLYLPTNFDRLNNLCTQKIFDTTQFTLGRIFNWCCHFGRLQNKEVWPHSNKTRLTLGRGKEVTGMHVIVVMGDQRRTWCTIVLYFLDNLHICMS